MTSIRIVMALVSVVLGTDFAIAPRNSSELLTE